MRKWQPTLVFLPGKFHGQRTLVGLQSQGCKELDMTEQLSTHAYNLFKALAYLKHKTIKIAENGIQEYV